MFAILKQQFVQMPLLIAVWDLVKRTEKHPTSLQLKPAMLTMLTMLAFAATQAQASSCGGAGQRACCVASTERSNGACHNGNAEIPGCSGDCKCGGSGLAPFFGSSSSSSCEAVTPCGHDGERACCITVGEDRWNDNPVNLSGGCFGTPDGGVNNLTEVALAGGVTGGYCGGDNPFGWRSNGTCVLCGSEGARECAGVDNADKCQDGLASVGGWCQSCGGDGQQQCHGNDYMCGVGLHPNGLLCRPDTVIAEPDCNCIVGDTLSVDPLDPVVGYADMHLHLFSNLAFGGLMVWGEAFHPEAGISQALRADNFAQRTLRHQINGHTIKGVDGEEVAPDGFRAQTIVHGDDHFFFDAPVTNGTGEGSVSNGGVEWDPGYAEDRGHFTGWPKAITTTHQQAYYRWLQRAHKGGLQLIVMLAVNNDAMCASARRLDYPEFDCADTMAAVRLQLQAAKDMEQWLNQECSKGQTHACAKRPAISGQPQQGWFKIVYSPEEAREVIAAGQMAAVLGIEESFLFDCRPSSSTCDRKYIQQELDKYQQLGVRHIFPIHNFDNAFGGTATWQDTIAIANRYSTGAWFTTEECPQFEPFTCLSEEGCEAKFGYDFKHLFDLFSSDGIFSPTFFEDLGKYMEAHLTGQFGFGETHLNDALNTMPGEDQTTCNSKGLTSLGNFLIHEMMARGMIIDIDHMSSKSVDSTLSLAEAEGYPGIVASHVLMLDLTEESVRHERMRSAQELKRIASLGGMIGAMTQPPVGGIIQPDNSKIINDCPQSSMTWGQMYEYAVEVMDGTPVAFGTDFNGISAHNGPRNGCGGNPLEYPFTLDGFGTFDVQITANRHFNFNSDGLAHIGLLPDMVQDLKQVGLSEQDLEPLFQSAEKYISMWASAREVAEGIEPSDLTDQEPPVLELNFSTAANMAGWHKQPFTIELVASDNKVIRDIVHSTIEDPLAIVSLDGATNVVIPVELDELMTPFFAIAYDLAGNNSEFKIEYIKIDQLPPLIDASQLPLPNEAGWSNAPVTVAYQCEDDFSGIVSCPQAQVLLTDGSAQSTLGVVYDLAGNDAQVDVIGINIDQTPPTITADQLPLANAAGWNNQSVVVTYQCDDNLSGIVACPETRVLTMDGAMQGASALVSDQADNEAKVQVTGINIDQTPPTLVATQSPLANDAGWINKPVTVSYQCEDAMSGIVLCPATQVLSTDGALQSALAVVSDLADNETHADIVEINVDQVPPVIEFSGVEDGGDYFLGQVPSADCVTTDALSGVAEAALIGITGGTSNGVGLFTVSCTGAVDVADNTAGRTGNYWVRYVFDGFFSPISNKPTINKAKAGSALPIKFSLNGNHGLDILSSASPSSAQVSCNSGASISELEDLTVTADSSSLSYSGGKYSYIWKSSKSWSGSCRVFQLKLDDGSVHSTVFKFN